MIGISNISKDTLIKFFQETQGRRKASINYNNANEAKKTIEFRFFNQPSTADITIENIALAGGLIAAAERIGNIYHRGFSHASVDDILYIDLFKKIRKTDTSEKEKMELLLKLCIPKNMRESFRKRYEENSRLLQNDPKLDGYLNCNIADFILFDKREMSQFSSSQISIDLVRENIKKFHQSLIKYQHDLQDQQRE